MNYMMYIILVWALLPIGANAMTMRLQTGNDTLTEKWSLGPFLRPEGVNPVLKSCEGTEFYCPMRAKFVKWEEGDVFNPAATVKDDKIVILYRAEDKSGTGIGKRTSRIGYAESKDGINFLRQNVPVLYPMDDYYKDLDWTGGCEDPRVAMTEEGLYVMLYTSWNRRIPRLSVATSKDLKKWSKHGLAFAKAYNGRFAQMASKSASLLTKVKDGRLVIDKVKDKYLMYWGEYAVYAAVSDNLTDWYPVLDERGELKKIAEPRKGYFDSQMTECGPPALRTNKGIVLLYNGKNDWGIKGDTAYHAGSYCGGQLLISNDNPYKVIGRLDEPFFVPEASFERSGQYIHGTVFLEGLVYYNQKFYLYYGCADSRVGVAVWANPSDINFK